jgi:hypothetical protein
LPRGPDDVPGDKERQAQGHEAEGGANACLRHRAREREPERYLNAEDREREDHLPQEGPVKLRVGEDLFVPLAPDKDALLGPHDVLHGVIDDRHQRNDGAERDDADDR